MYHDSLENFSIASASKDPVPGGGGVSGAVGALAASLAQMVTNLTIGKKYYASYENELKEIKEKSERLRCELLESINEDAKAFKPLADIYSLDRSTPDYDTLMEEALRNAALSPYNIMTLCRDVIELDERLAVIGSKIAVSDAATSVMLAHGALYGAFINVRVNTRLMKDKEYAAKMEEDARAMLNEYSERALSCYKAVEKRLADG